MKITEKQLRQIIREEVKRASTLKEYGGSRRRDDSLKDYRGWSYEREGGHTGISCSNCDGIGLDPKDETKACPECHGEPNTDISYTDYSDGSGKVSYGDTVPDHDKTKCKDCLAPLVRGLGKNGRCEFCTMDAEGY
jgi:hypothetical protein